MTDPRPIPRYGEYADVPGPRIPAPPATPPPAAEPQQRRHHTWDVVLSSALLLIGVFDVVTGLTSYTELGVVLHSTVAQQGFAFTSVELANEVGWWLNVARVALLVIAILATLLLLQRRRLAFWVPLAAGVVAGLSVVVCVIAILVADPGFAQFVLDQNPGSSGG